jgi:hypothetical protein
MQRFSGHSQPANIPSNFPVTRIFHERSALHCATRRWVVAPGNAKRNVILANGWILVGSNMFRILVRRLFIASTFAKTSVSLVINALAPNRAVKYVTTADVAQAAQSHVHHAQRSVRGFVSIRSVRYPAVW